MAGPHFILEIFRRVQERHPALIEQHPGVSEPQTPRRTQQQRHPQLIFQLPYVKADHRLGLPQRRCGKGETAGIYHGDKHGHALKIKHRRPDDCQKYSDSISRLVPFIPRCGRFTVAACLRE